MSVLAAANEWLIELVTGPLATGLLTLAVAILGLALLTGRNSWKRGAHIAIGAFVLIGSSVIAQALITSVPRGEVPAAPVGSADPPRQLPEPPPSPPDRRGNPFDPYSGNNAVN